MAGLTAFALFLLAIYFFPIVVVMALACLMAAWVMLWVGEPRDPKENK
jgi:hypothetical protein